MPGKNSVLGFTLVELLVVITIIAVLSTIGMVIYGSVQSRGRDAKRVADIKDLVTALELYNGKNNAYPAARAYTNCSSWYRDTNGHNDTYIPGLVPTYMKALPLDPFDKSGGPDICYLTNTDGSNGYRIDFRLENRSSNLTFVCNANRHNENGHMVYGYSLLTDWTGVIPSATCN